MADYRQRCGVPLIYNFFPLVAGPLTDWAGQLPRIAALGFNWLFLNPIHYPGFSGSLYAVKDYFRLHPRLVEGVAGDPLAVFRDFVRQAENLGLRVMLDLVLNHTASDALLVAEHPEWYARNPDGTLKHPSCIDPADARKVTVWGDLAELAYWPPPDKEGLLAFFLQVIRFYLQLGISGFRADAAYKVPGDFWRQLIRRSRRLEPRLCFVAETLGCRLEEIQQLQNAGFDFLMNSSKWWDFQAPWCLEQYQLTRRLAPTISFPETHDTERLIVEAQGDQAVVRQRYLFAAFFSAGLLMPIGFEYGVRRRLHVIHSSPEDLRDRQYDLSDFIARVNRMKLALPVLQEEGPIRRLTPPGEPVVILRKTARRHPGRMVAVINAGPNPQPGVKLSWKKLFARSPVRVQEWPAGTWLAAKADLTVELTPRDIRLYYDPGEELRHEKPGTGQDI